MKVSGVNRGDGGGGGVGERGRQRPGFFEGVRTHSKIYDSYQNLSRLRNFYERKKITLMKEQKN